MSAEAWIYILALVIDIASLFVQVYHTVLYSDLECDFINPIELCDKLNMYFLPEAIVHAFLTFLFLVGGCWIPFFLNLPIVAYHGYTVYTNSHLLDVTEIFRILSQKKVVSFAKILTYLFFFFFYLYCMITSLIQDE